MKYLNLILVSFLLFIFSNCERKAHHKIDLSQNKILVDPFSVAPLTAIVQITDPEAKPKNIEKIFIKVLGKKDKYGNAGIEISDTLYPHTENFKKHFFDITKHQAYNDTIITSESNIEIPVLGLYPNYENKVYVEIYTNKSISSDTLTITTKDIADDTLSVDILKCKPELMEPGEVTWMTADAYKYDFMFDRNGEIRWIIDVEGKADLRILANKNLLISTWWAESDFGEYNLLGEQLNHWQLPVEFKKHHDIYEMPNGNLLVPVTYDKPRDEGYQTVQDNLIELDRESGEIVNNWDLYELMDIANLSEVWYDKKIWHKDRFLTEGPRDWFHMNSVVYDKLRDEIIVSGKHGGVIKLSRNGENGQEINKNKSIIWYMPMQGQYSSYIKHNATKDYILTAIDSAGNPYNDQSEIHVDFHWNKFQHHPIITHSEGDFVQYLIFNNVYDEKRSAIVEYLVNEKEATVQEVWQYGGTRKDLYAPAWAGTALFPLTDNRLMVTAFKFNPKVEVTNKGEIAFEYLIKSKNFNPKWYRGGRTNLYPGKK